MFFFCQILKLNNIFSIHFRKEDSNCDKSPELRLVNNQVLLDITKDIRPPPSDPSSDFKVRAKGARTKETFPAIGPMPNFEREIQKIIAQQVRESQPNLCK